MQNAYRTVAGATPDAGTLDSWRAEGWQSLEKEEPRAALETFLRLIAGALTQTEQGAPANGLQTLLGEAVSGVGQCLARLEEDADARREAFEVLFDVYEAEAGRGRNGLTKDVPFIMLQNARPQERAQLIARVRAVLSAARDTERAEHYWRLLLDLEAAGPAPLGDLFARCIAAGYAGLVAEKLLDLDRVGEALITARQELRDTAQFLHFANSPAGRGQARPIMAIVEERLAKSFDVQLADWLATRYAERGDLPRALAVRLKLLEKAPGNGDYGAVHTLASRLGLWQKLEPEVMRTLQRSKREEARAELALGAGDYEAALQYVGRAPERYSPAVVARLAEAVAEAHPREAEALYRHLVERALARGEREVCREAVRYLLALRALAAREGWAQEWSAYVAELEGRHAGWAAFGEELRAAGL